MKDEHKKALEGGETLECPTGFLMWSGTSGYFDCKEPDCMSCEDVGLTWEDVERWYGYWEEDEWGWKDDGRN